MYRGKLGAPYRGGDVAAGEERGYDAFISYSHRLDAAITARLQAELQRFAKPWYRLRALHALNPEAGAWPGRLFRPACLGPEISTRQGAL